MNRLGLVAVFVLAGASAARPPVATAQARIQPLAIQRSSSTQGRMEGTTSEQLSEQLARDWHLNSEEWTRYQRLMQGPLGIWSPDLDPLTALGIEARSDAEREHYAELEVRMEGERVAKILTFQRAYDAAWKRLYPHLEPVNFAAVDQHSEAGPTGRLAVFVKEPCPACITEVQALESQGRAFDIYMVGLETDADIRAWATRVDIDPDKVRAGMITLNHDAGRWLAIGDPGPLPAVLTNLDGQWHRE
jgi:integrating conjugative element protein (TIGR03759 family)